MLINVYFKYREKFYLGLITIVLLSFLVSYAINSIAVFLMIFLFILYYKENLKKKLRSLKKNLIVKLYLLFFLAQLFSLFYSENFVFGLKRLLVMLPLVFLPGIIISEKLNPVFFEKCLNILKYWIVAVFSYFIIIHVFVEDRALSVFVPYIIDESLGISQSSIFFILIILFLFCFNKVLNNTKIIINILYCIFFCFCILLLANRVSAAILIGLLVFKSILFFKNHNRVLQVSIVAVIVSIFTLLVFTSTSLKNKIEVMVKTTDFDIETIITKNSVTLTQNTLEHRLLINYIALTEIKNNLPFGVGIGDFQDILYQEYININFKQGINNNFNNHNQYLAEFLKSGIFGGIVFIVLIIALIRKSKIKDSYYGLIIISFAFSCFFESHLYRQHGIVIFGFIIPLFLKYENSLAKRQ